MLVCMLVSYDHLMDTDNAPKKKLEKFYKAPISELIAYIDFTTGILSGVKVAALL